MNIKYIHHFSNQPTNQQQNLQHDFRVVIILTLHHKRLESMRSSVGQ